MQTLASLTGPSTIYRTQFAIKAFGTIAKLVVRLFRFFGGGAPVSSFFIFTFKSLLSRPITKHVTFFFLLFQEVPLT